MTPEEIQARTAMLLMMGMVPPSGPLEYSATKGYLPFDLGSMNTYTNIVDNWATPEMTALLRASQGLDANDAPPVNEGRLRLQTIADTLGETSMEGIIVRDLLDGFAPSEAVASAEKYMTTEGGLAFGDISERNAWRSSARSLADGYFKDMIDGDVSVSQGSEEDRLFGLPAVGTEFDLTELNPMIAPAAERFDTTQADARSLLKRDRMSALDERMGDEDAFIKAATDFAMNAARDGSGFQGYTKDAPDYGTQSMEGVQNIYDFYDRNVTGGVPNEAAASMRIASDGTMFMEDPRYGSATDSVSLMDWVKNNPKDSFKDTDLSDRTVSPDLKPIVASEARRDLQRARNYNAGLDYGIKEDTQDAVSKAVKDRNQLSKEARFAITLEKWLKDKGVSPRSMAANRYLSGGNRVFGG